MIRSLLLIVLNCCLASAALHAELTCSEVINSVAVRYAWADNPVCNLTSLEGLPVTPFRTDKSESQPK